MINEMLTRLTAVLFFLFISGVGYCNDSNLDQAIEVPPTVISDIESFIESNGRTMTVDEFRSYMTSQKDLLMNWAAEKNLSVVDLADRVAESWQSTRMSGPISADDLAEIFRAKMDSIVDYRYQYTYTRNVTPEAGDLYKSPPGTNTEFVDFAQSGNKLYRKYYNSSDLESAAYNARAYNGQIELRYSSVSNQGMFDKFESTQKYYHGRGGGHYLSIAGLLGTIEEGTAMFAHTDLYSMLKDKSSVYIRPEYGNIDGNKTIVVEYGHTSSKTVVHLDPQKGYAALLLERMTKINGVPVLMRHSYKDFEDTGNGLFLPKETTVKYLRMDSGKAEEYVSWRYDVKMLEVNKGIEDSLFEAVSVFDSGAKVWDSLADVSY